MYQVTWIQGDELHAVQSPNYKSMRGVLVALACMDYTARLWDVSRNGKPRLIG